MKRTKKWLAGLLCAVLLVGLLPTAALAADASWANQAVNKLNEIYGGGVFTASTDTMTVGNAYTVLSDMGCTADGITENSTDDLTRGAACTALADIFKLPLGEESAIQYLYDKNIVNGKSNGNLDESGGVSKAEFAVLTYRVLNSMGGGKGSSVEALKPGTKEYFAWMYLAARKAVSFDASAASGNIDNDTWQNWITKLTREEIPADAKPTGTFNPACPVTSTTKLSAAVQIVDAYIQAGGSATIFSDVQPGQGWYDGVMYLFDQQIIQGNGNGKFTPGAEMPRYQLAVMLAVLDQQECANIEGLGRITGSIAYALQRKYMTGETSDNPTEDVYWSATVTREEAIVAIMKQQNVNVSGVNANILERFKDKNNIGISETEKPYLAYAVSIGLVNGDASGNLNPTGSVTRGVFGVLLYRTLIGVDTTKMKDYQENVFNALNS